MDGNAGPFLAAALARPEINLVPGGGLGLLMPYVYSPTRFGLRFCMHG